MSPSLTSLALLLGFWWMLVLVAGCMAAMIAGPSAVDRIVALDLGIVLTALSLGLFAALEGDPAYMDASLVLAVLSFLVTVAVSRYLETGRVFR